AGAAAGGRVVDGAVAVGGEITDLNRFQCPGAGFQCAAGQRQAERARKHLRVERQHRGGKAHLSPPASLVPRARRGLPLSSDSGPSSPSLSIRPAAAASTLMNPPAMETSGT